MTYLQMIEIKDTGKTKVWRVENSQDGSYLGNIKWHGAWRKYVLKIDPENVPALWSGDCLEDVSSFIARQMAKRKVRGNHEA